MFERLQAVEDRYDQLNELLSDPEIVSDISKLRDYSKEQSGIQETVDAYRQYKRVKGEFKDAKEMLNESLDEEMRELVKLELSELEDQVEELEAQLKVLLIPKDPNDEKNVIMEIRGAAGGDEAALFAGNLFRMYSRYAEMNHWKTEVIE
ncbi:PCRF domain-containing protein, partial [Microvirga sp. 3-52]|nr:PCRF domain-containing protein [Microvirga sp. 3-52]